MYFTHKPDAQRFFCVIPFHGRDTRVIATIQPVKHAPHVGADSPRFMDPGAPAFVLDFTMLDDEGEWPVFVENGYESDEVKDAILVAWRDSLRVPDGAEVAS